MNIANRIRTWSRSVKREGVALWFAARDKRTPLLSKLIAGFVVAYALSPIDLIPDFIPILGYLDDVILLPGLMWLAMRAMPRDLMEECRAKADNWLRHGGNRPKSRAGAIGIVVVWVAAAAALIYWWLRR